MIATVLLQYVIDSTDSAQFMLKKVSLEMTFETLTISFLVLPLTAGKNKIMMLLIWCTLLITKEYRS